ncbi:uncharacterized protein LOC115923495 [Strongylocentrotus purpuratus]|uniref:C-type lectin domain-containing protein n=1 Tax=Strongylocentrotus purpuratus TaxID=7668 RepID=A0A7M7NQT3_STRPU|nr:uncharacterized protein LOC115923495 [Strongylocentrotus purpuratus]
MHLVYIGSEDEQEFLVNNLPARNFDYWIGLSSVTWLDGSSLTYSIFAADSHIISNNGMCFVINRDKSYQWLDDDCNIEHHYICEREEGHTSFKNFRLLASNVAHIDAYVLSSFTVSSMIECSQLCLTDVRCSCYTFIACEGLCLLGEECLATSTFAFERRIGATFYSALLED